MTISLTYDPGKESFFAGYKMNKLKEVLRMRKKRVLLFPSPVLTGSGSEGIISARVKRAPLKLHPKV
jgi:hypothetical protein